MEIKINWINQIEWIKWIGVGKVKLSINPSEKVLIYEEKVEDYYYLGVCVGVVVVVSWFAVAVVLLNNRGSVAAKFSDTCPHPPRKWNHAVLEGHIGSGGKEEEESI